MLHPTNANPFTLVAAQAPGTLRAANRYALDYRAFAAHLGPPPITIFDFHTHVNGAGAALIWAAVADAFGIGKLLTMVPLAEAPVVKAALGSRVGFIAFPNFRSTDRSHAMRDGFTEDIQNFHYQFGSRMIKLWNAPRLREYFPDATGLDLIEFDGITRVKHIQVAQQLGMAVMVHIADPDTWFATKYANAAAYGLKLDYYRGLRAILSRFSDMTFVAAHLAGYSENLDFLDALLTDHPNLYLDCSATKWIVRELSRYPAPRTLAFLSQWQGRILFGSDIVTTDEHLAPKPAPSIHPMADLADSPESAFDLYASRYATYRVMFECGYTGVVTPQHGQVDSIPSPIADPDLAMVDPTRFTPLDAPLIRCLHLPAPLLTSLYSTAAATLMAKLNWTI